MGALQRGDIRYTDDVKTGALAEDGDREREREKTQQRRRLCMCECVCMCAIRKIEDAQTQRREKKELKEEEDGEGVDGSADVRGQHEAIRQQQQQRKRGVKDIIIISPISLQLTTMQQHGRRDTG